MYLFRSFTTAILAELLLVSKKRQAALLQGDMQKYRSLRNKVNRMSSRLRSDFYTLTVQNHIQSRPRQWWRGVKRLLGENCEDSSMKLLANSTANGDMNLLAMKINKTFQDVTADLPPLLEQPLSETVVPEKFIISVNDVKKALSKIQVHKAVGPDAIPNRLLRDFAQQLAPPICAIFNSSIQQSYVPAIWRSADVVPLPKKKPLSNLAKDLRPISLTPVLSKTLESFVVGWMRSECVHSDSQYGAISGRSTTHALIDTLHKVHSQLDGRQAYARILLLDFSKAFDHIDHAILLEKLSKNDIHPGQRGFLTNRRQRIKIGATGVNSEWAQMNGGVPQGTLSGPEDFLHMIDDFETCLEDIKFVDDTTIFEIVPISEPSKLQEAANEAVTWASHNNMSLNASKTKEIIVYYGKKDITIPPIMIEGQEIERVSEAKLLGVTLTSKLTWEVHIDNLCRKANSRLYYLRHLKRAGLPTAQLLTVYKALIRSVTEYACQAWSTSITKEQSNLLEQIQQRAFKIILPMCSYEDALQLLSETSLQARREDLCE